MFCPGCAAIVSQSAPCCDQCGQGLSPALWGELRSGETFTVATGGSGLVDLLLEGRYRVQEPLGKGAMGEVHLGLDVKLDRPVAIKFLAKQYVSDALLVQRFLLEARSAGKLDHPNVVSVLSAGEEGGRPFIVMRLLRGRSLDAIVREDGPLSVTEAAGLIGQACDGLAHIHENGFVHRDLKPQNLMRTDDGRCVILDFGILRDLAKGGATSLIGGTPDYMPPEQASEPDRVDIRSDLYALGATFFHLVTGRPPFVGASSMDVLVAHRSEPPPRASSVVSTLAPELDAVLLQALAKRPAARFQHAQAFHEALVPFLSCCGDPRVYAPRRHVSRVAAVAMMLAGLTIGSTLALLPEAKPQPACAAEEPGAPPHLTVVAMSATGIPPLSHSIPANAATQVTPATPVNSAAPVMAIMPANGAIPAFTVKPSNVAVPSNVAGPAVAASTRIMAATLGDAAPALLGASARGAPEARRAPVTSRREPSRRAASPAQPSGGPAARIAVALAPPPAAVSAPVLPRAHPVLPPALSPGKPGVIHVVVREGAHASWASVSVDGEPFSDSLALHRPLAAGAHVVRASRAGYVDVERRITVAPGEVTKVLLELRPR